MVWPVVADLDVSLKLLVVRSSWVEASNLPGLAVFAEKNLEVIPRYPHTKLKKPVLDIRRCLVDKVY